MKSKVKQILLTLFILSSLMFFGVAQAQQEIEQDTPRVEYKSSPITDTDLDGLTDEGEEQLYQTDSGEVDTDGDGYYDSVEVLAGTDPLASDSFPGMEVSLQKTVTPQAETPWAWYFARTSGLVAFLLLYVSIFLGLTIRIPLLRKIFSPIYSVDLHCLISLYATLFALFHGVVLIFDKMFGFTLADVLIPFVSKFETNLMALGIFGFYLMVILVLTSYAKKFISQKIWRLTHFTNIILYVLVVIHAARLGTDLKNPIVFDIFLWANALLILVMLYNAELRIGDALTRRKNNKPQQ